MHAVSLLNVSGNRGITDSLDPLRKPQAVHLTEDISKRGLELRWILTSLVPRLLTLEPSEDPVQEVWFCEQHSERAFSVSRRNSYSCVWLVKITHSTKATGCCRRKTLGLMKDEIPLLLNQVQILE